MVSSEDLNVVMQCYISFANCNFDHLLRWLKFASTMFSEKCLTYLPYEHEILPEMSIRLCMATNEEGSEIQSWRN